jgi:uncharacterized membrane protein
MQTLILYAITALVFLALDAVMLRGVIGPVFREYLGDALRETPKLGAAAVFYLAYVAGLLVLVSRPAFEDGDAFAGLWKGALLGFVAYGTYEMTNYATLKDWSLRMVVLDWTWGTVLTGLSAWAGVVATRAVFGSA